MIFDLQKLDAVRESSADVCVVGAGAAGITLAVELSRLGVTVLLLEGGGLDLEDASQRMYQSEIVGLPHRGIHDGRFRAFGGTTIKWGGQILELYDLDFRRRPWVADSGWPFGKSTLSKYYQRAMEIEGVSNTLPSDEDVWKALHSGKPSLGPGLETLFTRWCPQPNFVKLYRQFIEKQPGLTAYVHANLQEFILSESREAITSLLCKTIDGREFRFTARCFVICLGGIETARLLLQPLKDGAVPPWNRSDKVGRYFQDHITVSVARLFPADPDRFHSWFDNAYLDGFRYVPKIKLSGRLQEELALLAVGARFLSQSVHEDAVEGFRHTVMRLLERRLPDPAQCTAAIRAPDILIRKAWRYLRYKRAYNPDDLGIDLRVECEQAPNPSSRVTLSEERDAMGLFKSRLDWRIGEQEIRTIDKFAELVARQFEAAGIAKAVRYPETLHREGLMSKVLDSYHHMGTARMSSSPEHGVVDENCRLFGIANGFVCSSAVFPNSGFANPTHTTLALAVRLAEHIARGCSAPITVLSQPEPVVLRKSAT